MKRLLPAFWGLCLLCASSLSAAEPPNGHFENIPLGELPPGWRGVGKVVRVDGGQCVEIPGGANNSLRTPLIPVDPKTDHALEFDLRIEHKAMNLWIQFQSFDGKRKALGPEWHNASVACYSAEIPTFVRDTTTFKPGVKFPDTRFVSIVFKWGRDSAGTAWVDNICVIKMLPTRPVTARNAVDLSKWVTGRPRDHNLLRTLSRLAPDFRLNKIPFSISRGDAPGAVGVIVSADNPTVQISLPKDLDSALLFYAGLTEDAAASAQLTSGASADLATGGEAMLAGVIRSSDGKGYHSCWLQEIVSQNRQAKKGGLRIQHRKGSVALLALTTLRGGPVLPRLKALGHVLYSPSDASWLPVEMPLPQAAGGALDVSSVLDPPAGTHGFVTSRDGHFFFEDGTRVRLFGTTVGYSAPYQEHEIAEALADHIARNGYNIVRIHPDMLLIDRSTGGTRVFNEEMRDRLEYFIAQLKKRGIYTFFYSPMSREFTLKDGVKVAGRHHITGLWNRRRIELVKEWWTNLLTHENPHTGLPLAKDPTLAMIVMMNENEIFSHYAKAPEPYKNELKAMWNEWLRVRFTSRDALAKQWGEELRDAEDPEKGTVALGGRQRRQYDFGLFCDGKQRAFAEEMGSHLQSIGVRVPMAVTNHQYSALCARNHAELAGLMGQHWYWGHPSKEYASTTSMLIAGNPGAGMRHPATISNMAKVRGKPIVVGEWNAGWPQPYRHEIILLMTAYACLQDWDGLVHFLESAFTPLDRPELRATRHSFDCIFDPSRQRLLPVATLMFHRADVRPAKRVVEIVVPWEEVDRRAQEQGWPKFLVPPALNVPPMICRTRLTFDLPDPSADAHLTLGSVPGLDRSIDWSRYYSERKRSAEAATAFGRQFVNASKQWGWDVFTEADLAKSRFRSDTGELVSDFGRKLLTIDTPRCQAVVGFPNLAGTAKLTDVSFNLRRPCSAVVISLSGEPIRQAKRLLLAVVGDSVNASLDLFIPRSAAQLMLAGRLETPPSVGCTRIGQAPALVEPVPGRVTLLHRGEGLRVFVLGSDGRRIKAAQTNESEAGLEIDLDAGGYLWEMVRK